MYLYARNKKQNLTPEPLTQQTSWNYEFSQFIEQKIMDAQDREMEKIKKESKQKTSNTTSKRKR